jgi:hypothetical protein
MPGRRRGGTVSKRQRTGDASRTRRAADKVDEVMLHELLTSVPSGTDNTPRFYFTLLRLLVKHHGHATRALPSVTKLREATRHPLLTSFPSTPEDAARHRRASWRKSRAALRGVRLRLALRCGSTGKSAQRLRFFDFPRAIRQDHSPWKGRARVHNRTMSAQSQPVELSAFARWAEKVALV